MKRVDKIKSKLKHMFDKREPWLTSCMLVSDFIEPSRGHYDNSAPKDRQPNSFNTKAQRYANNFSSILFFNTPPSRPWVRLQMADQESNEWNQEKLWISDTEKRQQSHFATSNFYNELNGAYKDFSGFGTSCICIEQDDRNGKSPYPVYKTFMPGEWYGDIDSYGEVDTVYTETWMTAKEIMNRFPKANKKQEAKEFPYKMYKVIHAVEPRENYDSTKIDNYNMPFASYWWVEGEEEICAEGGFRNFPFMVSRWNPDTSSPYSTGLGWLALKEAKVLNLIEKSFAFAVNKAVDPPLLIRYQQAGVITKPSAKNYYQGNLSENQVQNLFAQLPDFNGVLAAMQHWEETLKEVFMNDLFLYLQNLSRATAAEVTIKDNEKLMMLAPVVERVNSTLLSPLVNASITMMMENGLVIEPPASLMNRDIQPRFTGILSQALTTTEVDSVLQLVGSVMTYAQVFPDIVDKINSDQVVDILATKLNVPQGVVRSDEEVEELRAQRAQAQQQAMQGQEMLETAEAMGTASKAVEAMSG